MWERRPMFCALIGLTLLLSLWSLSVQDFQVISELSQSSQSQQLLHHPPHQSAYTSQISWTAEQQQQQQLSNITHPPTVIMDTLAHNDFKKLIDLDDFSFKINQRSCHDSDPYPLVLILVHTAPNNFEKRNTIRSTWGRSDPRSKLLFLLGTSNSSQADIEYENKTYGDIVQGNFIDAYKNMTYKHIMALKWFTYYCPDAKYIVKTDDDVFIHSPNVYKFLENDINRKKFLFCYKLVEARVKRTYRSKWRVSVKDYPNKYYPEYCPGFSIVYSSDVAFQLYREGQKTPYFWIDDVHVTGTLAKKINIEITPLGDVYWKQDLLKSEMPDDFLFTVPNLREEQIIHLWQNVQIDKE